MTWRQNPLDVQTWTRRKELNVNNYELDVDPELGVATPEFDAKWLDVDYETWRHDLTSFLTDVTFLTLSFPIQSLLF